MRFATEEGKNVTGYTVVTLFILARFSDCRTLLFVGFVDVTFKGPIACSKRSDSGERCEVKKPMKSRGVYFAPLPTL